MLFASALLIFSVSSSVAQRAANSPRVTVNDGTVQGRHVKSNSGNIGVAFQGVPFAEPPVGELRFQDPVPSKPWQGVLYATDYAPACMQNNSFPDAQPKLMSEDCLYLNVFAPPEALSKPGESPVLFYMHGGGWNYDHPQMFPPEQMVDSFTSHGVVVVLPAYRLGVFGLWSTFTKDAKGNQAVRDIILAMDWTQQNIRKFGGDPTRVTLMGHSSAGGGVALLSLLPVTEGKFQQVVPMSGTSISGQMGTGDKAKYSGNLTITGVSEVEASFNCQPCSGPDCSKLVKCMQNVDSHTLLNIYNDYVSYDSPFVDHDIVPDEPQVLYRKRRPLSMLTGNTANEFNFEIFRSAPTPDRTTVAGYCAACTFGQKRAVFDACVYHYDIDVRNRRKPTWTDQPLKNIVNDCGLFVNQYHEATTMRDAGANVYLYSFDFNDYIFNLTGPTHASDVMYLFGIHPIPMTDIGQGIRDYMGTFFSNFVKNGKPDDNAEPLRSPTGFNYFSIDLEENRGPKEFFHFDAVQFFGTVAPYLERFANSSSIFARPKPQVLVVSNVPASYAKSIYPGGDFFEKAMFDVSPQTSSLKESPLLAYLSQESTMTELQSTNSKSGPSGSAKVQFIVIGVLAGIVGLGVVAILVVARNRKLKAQSVDETTPLLID